MIRFNLYDYRMADLRRKSGLANLDTHNSILVYGARNAGNLPITISLSPTAKTRGIADLRRLFAHNHIAISIVRALPPRDARFSVRIGIRRNVRESNLQFCSALLKTIVYALEGRLKIPEAYTLPNIPTVCACVHGQPLPVEYPPIGVTEEEDADATEDDDEEDTETESL